MSKRSPSTPVALLALFFACGLARADGLPGAADTAGFIERHCVECHDADTKKGDLDLTRLSFDLDEPANLAEWVKVHDKIRSGEMPPARKAAPPAADRDAFIGLLAARLSEADAKAQARLGRVQLRRLNRAEYQNTLADLLGVPWLDVKEMLPADAEAYGFDNVGEALTVSSVQLSRYLEAADAALAPLLHLAPSTPPGRFFTTAFDDAGIALALGSKNGTKVRGMRIGPALGILRQASPGQHPWSWKTFQPPADGSYTLRTKVFGFTWDRGRVLPPDQPHVISYYARFGASRRWLASLDVPSGRDNAAVVETTVYLHRGEELELYLATLDTRYPAPLQEHVGPGIAVEWLEANGPLADGRFEEARHRLFGELPVVRWTKDSGFAAPPAVLDVSKSGKRAQKTVNDKLPRYMLVSPAPAADAERLLRAFMERAYRRPVPNAEVERYLPLVLASLEEKQCFQEALAVGMKAALCSPDFLYLQESPGLLDDFALASRLSYFLWSSMPDQALLDLARRGTLHQPAELNSQIERMLADPRSDRFVENFTGQWLGLRQIRATEPDEELYPEFDELLLDSMTRETHAFFRAMLDGDLPVKNVVASDFLLINGPLARLYGIAGVEGLPIRRVAVPAGTHRGGILTQASFLKVSANGTTTSPVTRGAWVLRAIVGKPPSPPPPGIPAVEPDVRGTTTVRQQLDAHRTVESCAACHRTIDPHGFALESFDVMGGWRDRYRSLGTGDLVEASAHGKPVAYRAGPTVDCGGELDGRRFADVDAYRQLLLADQRQLARSLTEKLLVYATGAGIRFADRADVETILDHAERGGFGLRSLVHEVVLSRPFLQK